MKKEIQLIQKIMQEKQIDAYLITTQDYHNSEYVNPHFMFRAWATGFTGSAGSVVITKTGATLWVDGRYYLQGEEQLAGSGIDMIRASELGALKIEDHIKAVLPKGGTLGVDCRTVGYDYGKKLEKAAAEKDGKLVDLDIASLVWEDRPALNPQPLFILEEQYSGKSAATKIGEIREKTKEAGADTFVLSSLTEIAWTLNLRGNDVAYCPVFMSYLVITQSMAMLYAYREAISPEITAYLEKAGVTVWPYESFLDEIEEIVEGHIVLADPGEVSFALYNRLTSGKVILADNPTTLMVSIKNDTEIANLRKANIADGQAMVRTIYWVKKQMEEGNLITELSVSDYVLARRKEAGALDASFETIAGYGAHGAIVHYEPTPESDIPVEKSGFLLLDSGGHYLNGTTDITRTIAVGPLTEEQKEHFTLVLKGTIDLAMVVFPEDTNGANLDIYAHMPLWQKGLDFRHGTGHGIGYLLSVHEGPQNIRKNGKAPFVPGMVTSDEPGYYQAGSHGIRTENDVLCVPAFESAYGKFFKFETLTLCPIDLEGIIIEMLTEPERKWLNDYHKMVYEKLAPGLEKEVANWLKEATREI